LGLFFLPEHPPCSPPFFNLLKVKKNENLLRKDTKIREKRKRKERNKKPLLIINP